MLFLLTQIFTSLAKLYGNHDEWGPYGQGSIVYLLYILWKQTIFSDNFTGVF